MAASCERGTHSNPDKCMRAQMSRGGCSQGKSPYDGVSESDLSEEGLTMKEQNRVSYEVGKHPSKREEAKTSIDIQNQAE